ncbi:hypothetical protein Tco_0104800 [Tanacetum coccineum]
MEDDVDISALTIDQYITLIPDDIKPGPKIGYDEDTYEHVRTVLEIMDLFHFPSVTHDAIMLKGFPITLKGRALRWKDRLPNIEKINKFKQERDETLYYAWERYNDLLYQCKLHEDFELLDDELAMDEFIGPY